MMTSMTKTMATLLSVVLISPPLSERFCTLSPVEGLSCKPIGLKIKVTYKNRLLHKIREKKTKSKLIIAFAWRLMRYLTRSFWIASWHTVRPTWISEGKYICQLLIFQSWLSVIMMIIITIITIVIITIIIVVIIIIISTVIIIEILLLCILSW